MKPNVKHINVTELILAKQREADRRLVQQRDEAMDTLAWALTFCVTITAVLVLVAVQEGWW
jgi:hypothetical protein